jgi:hypothetical protein
MTAEFVPAVDRHHRLWWLDPQGDVRATDNNPDNVQAAERAGWRRLGWEQPVETPPFDHSPTVRHDQNGTPHIAPMNGQCLCTCQYCSNDDGECICPSCNGQCGVHVDREVTP